MTASLWHGFQKLDFEFKGHKAILVFPHEENKASNWLLKTEYFGAFPIENPTPIIQFILQHS